MKSKWRPCAPIENKSTSLARTPCSTLQGPYFSTCELITISTSLLTSSARNYLSHHPSPPLLQHTWLTARLADAGVSSPSTKTRGGWLGEEYTTFAISFACQLIVFTETAIYSYLFSVLCVLYSGLCYLGIYGCSKWHVHSYDFYVDFLIFKI